MFTGSDPVEATAQEELKGASLERVLSPWSGAACANPSREDRVSPELPSQQDLQQQRPGLGALPLLLLLETGQSTSKLVRARPGHLLAPRNAHGRPTEVLGENKCPWSQPVGRPCALLLL